MRPAEDREEADDEDDKDDDDDDDEKAAEEDSGNKVRDKPGSTAELTNDPETAGERTETAAWKKLPRRPALTLSFCYTKRHGE